MAEYQQAYKRERTALGKRSQGSRRNVFLVTPFFATIEAGSIVSPQRGGVALDRIYDVGLSKGLKFGYDQHDDAGYHWEVYVRLSGHEEAAASADGMEVAAGGSEGCRREVEGIDSA